MTDKPQLKDFNSILNFTSDQGNNFQDKFSNNGDPNMALLATIEKLGFIAKVSGLEIEAIDFLKKGFGE